MTPWTDTEDAILRASVADGLDDRAIGEQLGRSPIAVRKRRHRLDLLVRATPADPVDRGALRRLHAAGHPTPEIAQRLGVTLRTAQQLLHEEHLPAHRSDRRPGRPPRRQAELVELLREHGPMGLAEIVRRLDSLPSGAKGLLRRAMRAGSVVRLGRGSYSVPTPG